MTRRTFTRGGYTSTDNSTNAGKTAIRTGELVSNPGDGFPVGNSDTWVADLQCRRCEPMTYTACDHDESFV